MLALNPGVRTGKGGKSICNTIGIDGERSQGGTKPTGDENVPGG
jgi:hypothetical protein